jgi:hypothetical protein
VSRKASAKRSSRQAAPAGTLHAPSQRKLAELVGVSQPTLNGWLRDDRWPFPRQGPWSTTIVPEIKKWARSTLREPNTAGSTRSAEEPDVRSLGPERQAKLKLTLERAKMVQLERSILEGKYVSKEEVERGWAARVTAVKTDMLAVPRNIAASLVGLDAAAIEQALERALNQLCEDFARAE